VSLDHSRPLTLKVKGETVIAMYKDDPGVFYNEAGREVAPELAATVGFDIVALQKQRNVNRRVAEATKEIEREESEKLRRIALEEDPVFYAEHRGNTAFAVRDKRVADPKAEPDAAYPLGLKMTREEAEERAEFLMALVADGMTPDAALAAAKEAGADD
jgi:hypothetical protein